MVDLIAEIKDRQRRIADATLAIGAMRAHEIAVTVIRDVLVENGLISGQEIDERLARVLEAAAKPYRGGR